MRISDWSSDVCSSDLAARATLSDYVPVPHVYPAGRLDRDSEGLLILTDDGRLQARIAAPRHTMPKTYLVQVEGEPNPASPDVLRPGVLLRAGPPPPATVRRTAPHPPRAHASGRAGG